MADHHTPDWIGPALTGAAAVVGSALTFFGIRSTAKAPKADPQEVQNEGWVDLLAQMRLELKAAAKQRDHLNAVLEEERRAVRIEREAWRVQREAFVGEIAQLQAVAEGFERLLRRNGIDLPERKIYAPQPAQVVQTTLRQDGLGDDE